MNKARTMVNTSRDESELQNFNEIHRFFDLSPDLLAIIAPDGYFRRLNPAWETTLGFTLAEILASPILDLIHADDIPLTVATLEKLVDGRPNVTFENRYRCKDGTYRWLEWTSHYYDQDALIYSVARDITQRKETEEQARRSGEFINLVIDNLPVILHALDQNGVITLSEGKALQLLGVEPGQLVGQSAFEAGLVGLKQSADLGRILAGESLHTIRKHDHLYFAHYYQPFHKAGGQVDGIIGVSVDVTEQILIHETVQGEQKNLREFINAFPGLTVVTDLDGQLVNFNEQFAQRYRKPDVDLETQNIFDLLSPLNAQQRKIYVRRVIDSRQPVRFQSESRGRYFDVTLFPIFDADQQVVRIGSFVQDVTELKQAEDALKESEARFRNMADTAPIMIWMSDKDKGCVYVNQPWLNFRGQPLEQELGRGWTTGIHPDDVTHNLQIYSNAFQTQTPFEVEYRLQRADGEYRWILVSGAPRFTPTGEFVGYIGSGLDIHDRKQTEQKLRNSEQQFRRVLELAAEGIVLADATGAILLVNQQIEKQFGYTRDELFGRSVDILAPEAARLGHIQQRQDYMTHPDIRSMGHGREVFVERKDGSTFPAEISLSYVQREDDDVLVMAFVTDITERKQMEQDRLDHQRQQLELQREREIVELRERFMSMVSHEFRTPLTVIASSCEMLQYYYDRLSRERQMEKLQVINGQVHSMVGLLDDILALNKIQAGAGDFAPERLDLPGLCAHILDNMKLIDQNQHHFIFASDHLPPLIQADRRMLEHIITNLLSNAVKYSPPDTGIHFLLSQQEDNIRLEIRDQGIGIPLEDQEHLFEPFYRAHNAHRINGTGLGLTIVKHNVEKHGGSISCHSIEGQGTTFSIQLPALAG